jgi:hypothetical protein
VGEGLVLVAGTPLLSDRECVACGRWLWVVPVVALCAGWVGEVARSLVCGGCGVDGNPTAV